MKDMTLRIVIAAVVAVAVGVGAYYMRILGGATKPVTLPEHSLESLPMDLGSWKGENIKPDDERKDEAVGADETFYRLYRNTTGDAVSVHGAVFGEFLRSTPHSPLVCYPGNGWSLVKDDQAVLPGTGDPGVKVELAIFEINKRRALVMFWYQVGDEVCYNMEGLDAARGKLRSQCETWPSTIKFLLEMPMTDPDEDKAKLIKFAGRLYERSRSLQGTSYIGQGGSGGSLQSVGG